ncbi:MAG TPA: nitroreductase [Beijerinckiaceae bacterium]|nr:nitroreductase [Beijerinckiaceae bacterium]
MNSTIDMLKSRRSVPPLAMTGVGPDAGQLQTLLTVASRVPDHGKLAPWRFIIYEGEGRTRAGAAILAAFDAANPGVDESRRTLERQRFSYAAVVVGVVSKPVVHAKIPEWEQVLSAGAVCMNLTVAANAMGFATSWLTQWYCYDPAASAALGLRDGEKFAGFVHIGSSNGVPEDRPRPALDTIVSRF